MPKFDDYTQKTTPEDTDIALILDKTANVNKKTPFSGVWNWIVSKLTSAVISQLETTNKSIVPAINELNSNKMDQKMIVSTGTDLNTIVDVGFYSVMNPVNAPSGYVGWCNIIVMRAGDNPEYPMQILLRQASNVTITICVRIATSNVFSNWHVFTPTTTG